MFFGCYNLKDVYCLAEDVPILKNDAFYGVNTSSACLHVPASSIEQYNATEPWSGFGTIVPLPDEDDIADTKASNSTIEITRYNTYGHQIGTPQKGVNIIHYNDGTTRRIMIK